MPSSSLPLQLYTSEQTRQLDECAIRTLGVPGIVLMKRAGRALFQSAVCEWPQVDRWVVVCGSGNNAGDGYVFAALAAQKKHRATVLSVSPVEKLHGDAKLAYDYARQEGVCIQPFDDAYAEDGSFAIVDALLGTGINGKVKAPYDKAIAWMSQHSELVIAADIPSGLCANTGAVLGVAVKAALTVTFIGLKTGLLTGKGPVYAGNVAFDDLAVPPETYAHINPVATRTTLAKACVLPKREVDAHKGCFGHVLIVGGDKGYGGAAMLAAEMAAYSGAGLVGLATQPDHVSAALVRRPEIMTIGVPSGQELEPYLTKPSVLVVGPGLGQTPWSEQMLQQVVQANADYGDEQSNGKQAMVLDADALNILAQGRITLPEGGRHYVLTPHPGEAARLLGCSVQEVEANRLAAAKQIHTRYGGVVVLKGAGTVITDGESLHVANVGNPGLATGGSGDVLSGLLGSLLAQGLTPMRAAQLGVCLHGEAADLAVADTGIRGLLAAELIPYVRELLSE